MQARHFNQEHYFKEQYITAKNYVLPFIQSHITIDENTVMAEIGCGLGGNMLPFLEMRCKVWGIDMNPQAMEMAKEFYEKTPDMKPTLIVSDIYDVNLSDLPQFDLIVMRDVLEHIHDQEKFIAHLEKFIKPDGIVFIAFPPFSMPFGGHQQMCVGKIMSKLPYYHLLPKAIYAGLLKLFGETDRRIKGLLEIKETRLHLWKFHKIIKKSNFKIVKELLYLINPNYEVKFGLKPRKLPRFMNIPFLREFFITTDYILLSKKMSGRDIVKK